MDPAGRTMEAVVYRGADDLHVDTRPVPEPGPGQVLVEVARCGICGTDVHLVLEGLARPGTVLGHEWSGRVAAVGPDVTWWSVGDRVVSNPARGCGECRPCRHGRPAVCRRRDAVDYLSFSGAFADFFLTDAGRLSRIPDEVDDRTAALTEPLAVAMHGVSLAEVETDDRVLVTGAGPIGLLVTAVLASRGVERITVSEPATLRRSRARSAGAARAVTPDELPVPAMGRTVDEPFDVAIECSGNQRAITSAIDQLDTGGRLVVLGTGAELPRLNHNRVLVLELTIIGAFNYDPDGFSSALALLASGRLPLDVLIDPDEVGLHGILDAIHECHNGDRSGKVMVDPRAGR